MILIYLIFGFLNANTWLRFVYGYCSFLFLHCKEIIPKIRNKYSHKWNSADSFPMSKFKIRWAIYIFPRSVRLFCCRKYSGPIVGIYTLNRSRIHECGLGCAVSFRGIHKSDLFAVLFLIHHCTVVCSRRLEPPESGCLFNGYAKLRIEPQEWKSSCYRWTNVSRRYMYPNQDAGLGMPGLTRRVPAPSPFLYV